jgi:hypothetical protein
MCIKTFRAVVREPNWKWFLVVAKNKSLPTYISISCGPIAMRAKNFNIIIHVKKII